MRIAFLCGSLEPWRDGVGDYTRLLAEECARQGHPCALIALHDRNLKAPEEKNGAPTADGLPTLRLPATRPWPERIALAAQLLDEFQPEWISLQFVCYAFHPKGLVHGLAAHLAPLLTGRKLHIMFHELWLGEACSAPLKHRLTGFWQQRFILRMVQKLGPKVVHTSMPIYMAMLGRYGIPATQMALFGNIPITRQQESPSFPPELAAAGLPGQRGDWWIAVFFGTFHPEWSPEPLFQMLLKTAGMICKRIAIVSVGRMGEAGETLWEKLGQAYEPKLTFQKLGEQSAPQISALLQMADFGVATSPWQLIGKSGTATAMIEHGLPVIANRDDWHARHPVQELPTSDPLVHPLDVSLEGKLVAGLKKRPPADSRPTIAAQFTASLRAASI